MHASFDNLGLVTACTVEAQTRVFCVCFPSLIADRERELESIRQRPVVMLTARVHPGETNGSWVMKVSRADLSRSASCAAVRSVCFVAVNVNSVVIELVMFEWPHCLLVALFVDPRWFRV